MNTTQLCTLLKQELLDNGYDYGFFFNGNRYVPNRQIGFDSSFAHAMKTIYRIQEPSVTMREKVGTCLDTVLVMKALLAPMNIPNKIWLVLHCATKAPHTVLTFVSEGKVVYLELTPWSNKPWYGKELIYDDENAFLAHFTAEGYRVIDVTDKVIPGASPSSLLDESAPS